jgi:enterochelin esterase-like enzyme
MESYNFINNSDIFSEFETMIQNSLVSDSNSKEKLKSILGFINKNKHSYPFRRKNEVYFIYIGKAKLVHLVGDFNGWDSFDDSCKMNRISQSNIFYLKKTFMPDSRLDYQIVVDTEWILDPLNKLKILGGFGYNSELVMPQYTRKQPENEKKIPNGIIREINFQSHVQKDWIRKIYVYLPPNYDSLNFQRYPTLYAVDGDDYLHAGNAKEILDQLIYEQKIPPIIGIFINPLSPSLRIRDFNGKKCIEDSDRTNFSNKTNICRQKYVEFLVSELVPYIDKNFSTISESNKRAHIGVSLGGILSSFIGLRYPSYFKLIGSQSGSFWIDTLVYESFKDIPTIENMKIYLNAGTFEQRNYNHTKKFAEILTQKKYQFKEEYFNQGHSWGLWKETFNNMLEFLFGK